MKNRRVFVLGISGIIILLVTIILFALLKPAECNSSISLGLGFLLFAEVVLFGGLISLEFMQGSQIISRVGCGTVTIGYAVISAMTAIVCMIENTDSVKLFWIIEIVLTAIAVISFIIFMVISESVRSKDDKVIKSISNITAMVDSLTILSDNSKYGKQFQKLAEDLRFTDVSTSVEIDEEIEMIISKIEMELTNDEYSEVVSEYINKLSLLIKKRKNQVRDKKIGGL